MVVNCSDIYILHCMEAFLKAKKFSPFCEVMSLTRKGDMCVYSVTNIMYEYLHRHPDVDPRTSGI